MSHIGLTTASLIIMRFTMKDKERVVKVSYMCMKYKKL